MDAAVELPVLADELKVTDGLKLLRERGGSGLVTTGGQGNRVMEVDDLLHAMRTGGGDVLLADVPTLLAEPTVEVSVQGVAALVKRLQPDKALQLRTSVTVCRCTDDPSHVWRADELAQPGRCNLDGAPVDCS